MVQTITKITLKSQFRQFAPPPNPANLANLEKIVVQTMAKLFFKKDEKNLEIQKICIIFTPEK